MEPSSDHDTGSGDALRRFGPIVAIVVVVAVVLGLVVLGGGNDDETADATPTTGGDGGSDGDNDGGTGGDDTDPGDGSLPTGAIPFSLAEAAGIDAEFSDTCDLETGRLAMPVSFPLECYANVEPDAGYEPPPGVTEDSIKVVVYIPPQADPILRAVMGPVNADDTAAEMEATFGGYIELMAAHAQTYGRSIEVEYLHGSGVSNDEVAARADAVKAVEEMGAFAVLNFPLLSEAAWSAEIQARGRLCICGGGLDEEMAPQTFTGGSSGQQVRAHLAEYLSKKLAGGNAEFAGDESMHGRERAFGRLYLDVPGSPSQRQAREFEDALGDLGITLAEHIPYELDLGRLQEQITTMITRLKVGGVTSVILSADPISTKALTEAATAQDYFPEWILGDGVLLDTSAFGRTFDQRQWKNAFGISALGARVAPDIADYYRVYRWFHGEDPPAFKTAPVIAANPALFFYGLQAAGPNLTNESFRTGLFTMPIDSEKRISGGHLSFGERGIWDDAPLVNLPDHFGGDDFTEVWWDPTVEGTDEIYNEGVGMLRYVDGGVRYLFGEWTDEVKLFDPAGTVTEYTERPPGEEPIDYPPPNR